MRPSPERHRNRIDKWRATTPLPWLRFLPARESKLVRGCAYAHQSRSTRRARLMLRRAAIHTVQSVDATDARPSRLLAFSPGLLCKAVASCAVHFPNGDKIRRRPARPLAIVFRPASILRPDLLNP